LGAPAEVIASGTALLRSPAWTQIMTDALGRSVTGSTELEPSSRGAALYGWERLGVIANLDALPASTGAVFSPRAEYASTYSRLLDEQRTLFEKLFGANA
jgi:gluconokinase